jgi:phosphoribosylaminoimidazole-succinocarboxamide synthase
VKNIHQDVAPTETRFGRGFMHYDGDPFSVFDYGKMNWTIDGKGEDLYKETLKFFEVLEAEGIPTHFTEDLGPRKIGILLAHMLEYDDIEAGESIIYRIPIECVFSKIVTPVASLHRRLMAGTANIADYGLTKKPEPGETVILPDIKTSYSTKIETTDVYKGLAAMAKLAGLVGNEPERLDQSVIAAAEALFRDAEETGLLLADGKFEYVMGPGRNLIIADTAYTWDENRFLVELQDNRFVDVSKQFPRNIYTIMGWKKKLKEAQKKSDNKSDWPEPPKLTDKQEEACIEVCHAVRAAITRESGCDKLLKKAAQNAMDILDELKNEYHIDETGAEI